MFFLIFFSDKKKNPLCFLILSLPDLTIALQSCPIMRKKMWKNLKKITFFQKKKIKNKNGRIFLKNAILLVFQYYEDVIRPELSSPDRFRFQGG